MAKYPTVYIRPDDDERNKYRERNFCGKVVYKTPELAEEIFQFHTRNSKTLVKGIYWCFKCCGFHMTKRPVSEKQYKKYLKQYEKFKKKQSQNEN